MSGENLLAKNRNFRYYDLIMAAFVAVMIGNYFIKVLWEVFVTPLTYAIVNSLKRAEREDYFDRDTNFNPFNLET